MTGSGRALDPRAAIFLLALALRAALFPLADNKLGDAPVRSLIAERMNDEPGLGMDPREYRQFGPLHLAAMRPFLLVDGELSRASRWLSLLAGVAVVLPFLSLGRRLVGEPASLVAGLALACAPLHLQASVTAGSEALYVLLLVAAFERLSAAVQAPAFAPRTFGVAGLLGGLAAVTRYDSWIALPAAAAAMLLVRPRPPLRGLAIFAVATALLPAAWLVWCGARSGEPLALVHIIVRFHQEAAREMSASLGPLMWRLRQIEVWGLGLAAAMTPGLLGGLFARGARAETGRAGAVVAAATIAPIGIYLARGLIQGAFEPLARFGLPSGVLLLPFGAAGLLAVSTSVRRAGVVAVAGGFALAAATLAVAWGRSGPPRPGAEALAPITRLEDDDRALARHLRQHRRPGERVLIDTLDYGDIAITAAAGIPARESASLLVTRVPEATLAATIARTGVDWVAAREDSWLRGFSGEWPAGATRIGRWRVARVHPVQGP